MTPPIITILDNHTDMYIVQYYDSYMHNIILLWLLIIITAYYRDRMDTVLHSHTVLYRRYFT